MANHTIALKGAMEIEGALGVALVDSGSGMALGTAGSPMDVDLEVAAAGNSNVVQAKLRVEAGESAPDFNIDRAVEELRDEQALMLRPAVRLDDATRYIVAIRRVLDRISRTPGCAAAGP